VLLRGRIATRLRVRQLDRADVVGRGLRTQERRPDAVDAEDGARQHARVEVVQPEAARIRMDVAERVREQEEVAVLEHADAAEIGCGNDRRARRWQLDGLCRTVSLVDEGLRHDEMMTASPRPVMNAGVHAVAQGIAAPRHGPP
jgi:hypothetical protein